MTEILYKESGSLGHVVSFQGHYAILFAKALGAEVVAFSHSASKEKDIKAMGADRVVFTSEPDFHTEHKMEFSLILSTRDESKDFPLTEFIS